ncbi:MAG: cell division protein ZapA [Clostridiales Family XIII bacterium]|jgi:cell division protein ZapA|nr:cell division protein ZapA [Clostridiales Family XIII bacterium]
MNGQNKVTVTIYGHEYTISGERPRDEILKIAYKVDETMSEISDALGGGSFSSLAVLTAVNIADELFTLRTQVAEGELEKDQLGKDIQHYIQLWEEAKRSFLQYKEDAQASVEQKDAIQEKLNQKAIENDSLLKSSAEKDNRITELEARVQGLAQRLKAREEGQVVSAEQIRALEDKYKELEGNYFELQMENIQVKGDLERFRKLHE